MFKLLKCDHEPQRVPFIALLGVLTLDETERAELLALYETADVETVEIKHAADLPRNYLRFRRDEGEAEAALTLDPDVIPGLLQTSEYGEAIALSARRLTADRSWSDKLKVERLQRGELIVRESNPLRLRTLIDVAALYRVVGGPDVMSCQYDHLLATGSLPNVEIRAVPFSAGAYCVTNGALILLSFPLPDDEPMAAYIAPVLPGCRPFRILNRCNRCPPCGTTWQRSRCRPSKRPRSSER